MSSTPDHTRNIGDACCSKCGRLLLVNDSAITHTDMSNNAPLVLGNCCADLVIGSLIQDYATKIGNEIALGYWINQRTPARLRRIVDAAKNIAYQYELSLDYAANHVRGERQI
jgi:hypothetical protein